jgi:hypothetical protein
VSVSKPYTHANPHGYSSRLKIAHHQRTQIGALLLLSVNEVFDCLGTVVIGNELRDGPAERVDDGLVAVVSERPDWRSWWDSRDWRWNRYRGLCDAISDSISAHGFVLILPDLRSPSWGS